MQVGLALLAVAKTIHSKQKKQKLAPLCIAKYIYDAASYSPLFIHARVERVPEARVPNRTQSPA